MAINKLKDFLKNENEAILICSGVNRRYFTAFPSSDGYLVITKKDAVFFADSRYIEAAQKNIKSCRVQLLTRLSTEVKSFFTENNIEKVYTETENLSVSLLSQLRKILSPVKITPSKKLEGLIEQTREIKKPHEVECIKKAQEIAEEAFEHILKFIKPGVSEKQIALELDFYMLSHGAEALSFETIAVTGAKTSMPHGVPDDTIVKNGDFITMDFGAVYKGYHSDMTRTVAVGNITDEQKNIYDIVLKAQKKALSILKSGLPCADADKAARDIISESGFGDCFGHGTGHGVGIEIHESPNLSPRSNQKLKIGNIVTVEPGIYIPEKFGVRIEDMALITEKGSENLTTAPKELIIL